MAKKSFKTYTAAILVTAVLAILMIFGKQSANGIRSAINLCGQVLIPAIFPIYVFVLMLSNCLGYQKSEKAFLGISARLWAVFAISVIGGYPMGAKLLSKLVEDKKIAPDKAGVFLNCSIGSGPAFIIGAVGIGIFGSQKIGILIFLSHSLSSAVILVILRIKNGKFLCESGRKAELSLNNNFLVSVSEAADTVIKICSFVLIFSAIITCLFPVAEKYMIARIFLLSLEITNTSGMVKNIYLLTFMLGFGCFCVWFQILSVGENLNIKIPSFALWRIAHGLFSVVILKILSAITKTAISVSADLNIGYISDTPTVTASLAVTLIVFAISVFSSKMSLKLVRNMI